MPCYLVLQLIHPPARVLIQAAGRAVLCFRERTLDRGSPPRLRCFQFTRQLPVQGRLRRSERGGYLLLNPVGRGAPRLPVGTRRRLPLSRRLLQPPPPCLPPRRHRFRPRLPLRFHSVVRFP